MKLTEKILAALAILAVILKYYHIPGANVLLVLSTGILAMLYWPLGFALFNDISVRDLFKSKSYQVFRGGRLVVTIALGIGLSILVLGILFTLNRYPGNKVMLLNGLLITGLSSLWLLWQFMKTKDSLTIRNLIRGVIFFGLGLILYLSTPVDVVKFFYHDRPEYVEAFTAQYENPTDFEKYRAFRVLVYKQNFGEEMYKHNKEVVDTQIKRDFEDRNRNLGRK